MIDLLRALRAAENKIVILRAVKLVAEAADRIEKLPLHHKQMADIVDAREQVGVEIRLEMRVEQRPAVHVKLVLVGVEHLAVRVLIHCRRHLKQRVLRQRIVMIRQNDEIALCHADGGVRVSGDAEIIAQVKKAETAVACGVLPHHPVHDFSLALRASVCHADLPVFVGLRQNGIHHLPQIFFWRPVSRYHDRQKRLIRQNRRTLARKLLPGWLCQAVPLRIIVVVVKPLNLMARL